MPSFGSMPRRPPPVLEGQIDLPLRGGARQALQALGADAPAAVPAPAPAVPRPVDMGAVAALVQGSAPAPRRPEVPAPPRTAPVPPSMPPASPGRSHARATSGKPAPAPVRKKRGKAPPTLRRGPPPLYCECWQCDKPSTMVVTRRDGEQHGYCEVDGRAWLSVLKDVAEAEAAEEGRQAGPGPGGCTCTGS
jgi:hypothetical protein